MRICENGTYREMTPEEIAEIQLEQKAFEGSKEYKQIRIIELKQLLADTDYISCKIAEGVATKEEYVKELARRQAWREEINSLEDQIN